MENNKNQLIPINNSLVSIERQITIGDKIINQKIEALFNRGFHLMNSYYIKFSDKNYFFNFTNDINYFKKAKFKYQASNKKDYFEALSIFNEIISLDNNFLFAYFNRCIIFGIFFKIDDLVENYYLIKKIDYKNQFSYKDRDSYYESEIIYNINMFKNYLKIAIELNRQDEIIAFGDIYTALIFELLFIEPFTENNIKIAKHTKLPLKKKLEYDFNLDYSIFEIDKINNVMYEELAKNKNLKNDVNNFLQIFGFQIRKFSSSIYEVFGRYGSVYNNPFPFIKVGGYFSNHIVIKDIENDINKFDKIIISDARINYENKRIEILSNPIDLGIVVILELSIDNKIFDNEVNKIEINSITNQHKYYFEIIYQIETEDYQIINSKKLNSIDDCKESIVTISKVNDIYNISIFTRYNDHDINIEYTSNLENKLNL
jgi:hypothetical protein